MCPVTRWKNAICGELLIYTCMGAVSLGDITAEIQASVPYLPPSLCFLLLSQDCLTDRSAPKGSIVISCMYIETLEMNSGRLTGTCTCHQTAASGEVTETGGSQSDTETVRGGTVTAAEAHRDLTDLTAEERATGGEAGVERGGPRTSSERTNGHPDPDALTGGMIGIGAVVETGQGVEVETESQTG